jgi:hypothetical protein
MRKSLSFVFSGCLVTALIALLWTIDVVRQAPEIPVQTPDVSYVDIILHKKKHNPIDDLYPYHLEFRAMN